MIGTEIKWFVLRDRDGLAPEILKEFELKLNNSGIRNYHIWNRFEIENYLCTSKTITRAINSEGKTVLEKEIDDLILETSKEVFEEHKPKITTENQNMARSLSMENWLDTGAKYAESYTKLALQSIDNLFEVVPGKEVLGKLFVKIQNKYSVNLRALDIAREIQKEEIHSEIHDLFGKLSSIFG